MYEVRLSNYGNAAFQWESFETAKDAVKYVVKELHETGFALGGHTFDEKFEELVWVGKGRISE